MSDQEFSRLSHAALLSLHARVGTAIRRRGLTRTSNNPVADLAELVTARALELTLAESSTTGYDGLDSAGLRYEIKARRRTTRSKPTHLSALRGLDAKHFDRLVVLLFDEDYRIARAVMIPFAAAQGLARYRKHVNGHILSLSAAWAAPESIDITDRCRKAWEDGAGEQSDALEVCADHGNRGPRR